MQNSEARKRKEEAQTEVVRLSLTEALEHTLKALHAATELLTEVLNAMEGRSNESDQEA